MALLDREKSGFCTNPKLTMLLSRDIIPAQTFPPTTQSTPPVGVIGDFPEHVPGRAAIERRKIC
jgi:hypothetical protein